MSEKIKMLEERVENLVNSLAGQRSYDGWAGILEDFLNKTKLEPEQVAKVLLMILVLHAADGTNIFDKIGSEVLVLVEKQLTGMLTSIKES